ncbi:MAG: hypothetical protein WA705_25540 [Candidatus Ozemobacteraceae bacterium]
MGISRENVEKLIAIFRQDCENPLSTEKVLEKSREALQKDGFFVDVLIEKLRRERYLEISRSRDSWFSSLGWWFAKLFMWSSLVAALVGWFTWGKAAADPLTFALLGASGYYALIQIFTPLRLSRETKLLERLERESAKRSLELLKELEKQFLQN